jgi:hypothetical protein
MKITRFIPVPAIIVLLILTVASAYPQKARQKQNPKPATAPSAVLTRSPAHPFTLLWSRVDSLTNLGQPQSALKILDEIYAKAMQDRDDAQLIRAILFRIRLNSDFRENFMVRTIADLKKEISGSQQPRKQVLQSILAEVYWRYYQNNQYRFRDRTKVNSVQPDSVETWDLNTLSAAITGSYLSSLENADSLQRIPIGRFEAILDLEYLTDVSRDSLTASAARFIPTLYDFLADRALDFFTSEQIMQSMPAQHFEVDRAWYFAPTLMFAGNRMLIPADTAVPASLALRVFRDLATFHMSDRDPRALIEFELKRLAFVHEKYILPGKDSLYLDALRKFEQVKTGSPWSTSISYALASFLHSQAEKYQPLISDRHKWDNRSAAEVCEQATRRFPLAEGTRNCKILEKSVKEPSLQVTAESAVPAGKPSLALIGVKNIRQLYIRLVQPDQEKYAETTSIADQNGIFKFLTSLPAVKAWSQPFPDDGDFQKHSAEITVPGLPAGFSVILCSSDKDFTNAGLAFASAPFWSTNISYVSKRNTDGSFGWFLLDRETGLPLKNAVAEAWEKNYDYRDRKYTKIKGESYHTDEQGYIQIPPSGENTRSTNQFLKIFYKDDFLTTDNFYQYPVYKSQDQSIVQTMFYTDRAIYRPGQVIWFKGIITERTGDKTKIKPRFSTKVVFTDVNGQKISEQTLVSNNFGSVSGSFTAPTGVLPGQMTIFSESGSTAVSVEEYKRPTFDVTCNPLEGNYKLGEQLILTGKAAAFAGNPIDGGAVKYRVVRTARFPFWDWNWRWPMPASPQAEIVSGSTTSDADGKFTVSFTAFPDAGIDKGTWPVFDYAVYADVTDINGETQSTVQHVSVGYKSLVVGSDMPELVNLAKDTIVKITATNLNGRPTPAQVTVSLQRLVQPDRAFKTRQWERPDLHLMTREEFRSAFPSSIYDDENNPAIWAVEKTVFEKTISTDRDSVLNLLNAATRFPAPGSYLLILRATDPFGEVVEVKKYLTVFSPASKELPVKEISWYVPLKTSGEPGETARFIIGSAEDNVNVIYELRQNDSLLSREWIKLSKRAMFVELPVKESYRGNVSVNFMFVRYNRVFQHSSLVTVPYASKKLGITFESFRSSLDPGAREQWKIKINRPSGKAAVAEMMAGMYDASLDQFRSNEWSFNLYQRIFDLSRWDVDNAFRISSGQWFLPGGADDNFYYRPALKLNWFGTGYFNGNARYGARGAGGKAKGMMMEMMDAPMAANDQSKGTPMPPEAVPGIVSDTAGSAGNGAKPANKTQEPSMQVRRDFRETAFFYPVLETDSAGSLVIQFTAPESLTKWKLLGLAHTQDLDYGLVEKELVTKKELMVFPNMPRFVRQGDEIVFSAKIVNLSARELSGAVNLALTDALTGKPLGSFEGHEGNAPGPVEKEFAAGKGSSAVVYWHVKIPVSSELSVLQFRITAVSGNFSDGEEKVVPVLTNRMLVTESLPLPVRTKGTTSFSFEKLFKSGASGAKDETLKNFRLTLEFASNPAWYAIQALPSLNDKQYDNADAIFTAYWSNSVASFIANSNPKIKAVFESWKNLTPDALQSNLAKNQSLKSALLQETPWVMEAGSETGRKQKLGLFFESNNMESNLQENLRKLQKLQLPNGGWTWFAGMPENRYITQNIVTGLGKLYHLGITDVLSDPVSRNMVLKAITFLDGEMTRDYEYLKKQSSNNLADNHIGSTQIQYLYARTYFMTKAGSQVPNPGPNDLEAFNYYVKQAEKFWLRNDRYLQGMAAIALNRLGSKEAPSLILKSLSEKALHSPEMGMYWAGERGYYWFQAPIETQALMVEAYDEILNDKSTVDELKVWLLKQKQTQDWRSPRATLEACYALLLRGTDLLADDQGVKISLGKQKINTADLKDVIKEAGTGYFQQSWAGSEITPDMGSISVTKSTDGVAWGAVYWQYFENLDKITTASTPLHLEKKVFIETNTGSGPVLEEISSDTTSRSPAHPLTRSLKPGDKLKVRIILTVDRDLEFVHMKDMRAGGLEPDHTANAAGRWGGASDVLSGYRYQDGLGYYQSTTDQATNFFFDYLHKGTFVFEYALKVNAAGDYSNGVATIQCMYAPEFTAHSEGTRITVQ